MQENLEALQDWSKIGPLIEAKRIEIWWDGEWCAAVKFRKRIELPTGYQVDTNAYEKSVGKTPQEAAAKCYLAMGS
jgi:hypothetical protein